MNPNNAYSAPPSGDHAFPDLREPYQHDVLGLDVQSLHSQGFRGLAQAACASHARMARARAEEALNSSFHSNTDAGNGAGQSPFSTPSPDPFASRFQTSVGDNEDLSRFHYSTPASSARDGFYRGNANAGVVAGSCQADHTQLTAHASLVTIQPDSSQSYHNDALIRSNRSPPWHRTGSTRGSGVTADRTSNPNAPRNLSRLFYHNGNTTPVGLQPYPSGGFAAASSALQPAPAATQVGITNTGAATTNAALPTPRVAQHTTTRPAQPSNVARRSKPAGQCRYTAGGNRPTEGRYSVDQPRWDSMSLVRRQQHDHARLTEGQAGELARQRCKRCERHGYTCRRYRDDLSLFGTDRGDAYSRCRVGEVSCSLENSQPRMRR